MDVSGIIVLNKPKKMTSHDCVARLRRILKMKKIGHSGTLDPEVTGVLPICIGKATKLAEYITNSGKVYIGEITLGYSTTTEDCTGEVVSVQNISRAITRREILCALEKLTGDIIQKPSIYSAIKVNGKRLYEYARKGIDVEVPRRKVTIYELELLSTEELFFGEKVTFSVRVSCSKGTYIRSLAVSIGELLGYPAHMSELTRVSAGQYSLADAVTFDQVEKMVSLGCVEDCLLRPESAVCELPHFIVSDFVAKQVSNGFVFRVCEQFPSMPNATAIFTKDESLIAIYQNHPTKFGMVKPIKII